MEESGTEVAALTELCSLAMGVAATNFRGREILIGLLWKKEGATKLNEANLGGETRIEGFTNTPTTQESRDLTHCMVL